MISAESALADHHYVSPLDVLIRMRLLEPVHEEGWRRGRYDTIDSMIQANPEKVTRSLQVFQQWALSKGLRPVETQYVRHSRDGTVPLRFTMSGDPDTERFFRTHWISPALSEKKQEKLTARASAPEKPVVFDNLRDAECSECGAEISVGTYLYLERGQPLCMPCAKMDDLEFLPSGDMALTRRATKYSSRTAVVVRFSRSRKRYERQGILVEPAAIEQAEKECVADADQRAQARAADAVHRKEEDRRLTARMTDEIRSIFPRCPLDEAALIAAHTAVRGSGRVGRSAAGRALEERALTAAVRAAIRHRHTNYDELLATGVDRDLARERVASRVEEMLEDWRG